MWGFVWDIRMVSNEGSYEVITIILLIPLPVSKGSTRLKIVVRTGEDHPIVRVNGGTSVLLETLGKKC